MSKREYPDRPLVGVGAVLLENNRILLVKRKFEPKSKLWTLPGGLVKKGETVQEALVRELREECGLSIEPGRLVDVIDYIERDENNAVKYHYVLVDYEVVHTSGSLAPSSDAVDARWFSLDELQKIALPDITRTFLCKHYDLDFE
ncbi:MAG: NUDIX hydrolase [bacterium]